MSSLNFTSRWPSKRLGSIFVENKDKNTDLSNTFALQFSYGNIVAKPEWELSSSLEETYKGYTRVNSGDIVINGLNLNYDFVTQRVGLVRTSGIITSAYILLRKRINVSSGFYCYYFKAMDSQKIFNGMGTGIRLTLSYPLLKNLNVPVPPRAEQDQIVHFLDWKVSSINKLINIRKNEINKLEELKRSKILNCVMGQEDDVRSKLSSISWVKNIPYNWSEETLIQVAEEQKIKNVGLAETNLLSLSYGKIIEKDINTTEGLLPFSFEGYQIVYPGNIILRLTDLQNDRKSLRTGISTTKGIITSAYTCLKVRGNIILPEYLHLQLHSADLCKVFYGMGGGVRQSIGFKEIRNLIIAIPPIEEQRRILDVAKQIDNQSNLLIEKYREQISALNDLKQRLISDVVTGQIDVRNIEIPEYEYVDEEPESDSDVDRDFDNEEISEEA
jgi:type I restriction enzyme S subunit